VNFFVNPSVGGSMPTSSSTSPEGGNFRPPPISLLYGGMCSLATRELYQLGQGGWEWGTLAAFATGGFAARQFIKATSDWHKLKRYGQTQDRFHSATKQFGGADMATIKEILDSRFFGKEGGIAPPGSKKTMSIIVPTVLNAATFGQNLIINDPPGEIYSICRKALERANYKIYTLAPFHQSLSAALGGERIVDAGLDIYSSLRPDMDPATVRAQVTRSSRWLVPDKPGMDEKERFFHEDARSLKSFFSLTTLARGRKPSLPESRELMMAGPLELQELLEAAHNSTAFGGLYAELARYWRGILIAAPQQYAGGFGILQQYLGPYDSCSELGRHTAGDGLDPMVLTDPDQKAAVFVMYGLEMMETYSASMAMTLMYLLDSVATGNRGGKCTALIDEAGSMKLPIASMLEFYRKCRLRAVLCWQDLKGQAERNYGTADVHRIMAASQIKVGMNLQELETLEMFSKLCGTKGIDTSTLNDRGGIDEAFPDLSENRSHSSVPLLRVEDIRQMPDDQMLVVGGNVPPFFLNKVPYWQRRSWRKMAGRSPYYREDSI
jgi:type IV secretory pathway TraG/TraD family ATPase VirD4